MTGPCARCAQPGRLYTVVALNGDILRLCARCADSTATRSGDWGIRSQWAARKLPTAENVTRQMAGRRKR